MNRLTAESLKLALTGCLHVADEGDAEDSCSIEAAAAYVAAAQLRAVRFAMLVSVPDDEHLEEGRGWCVTGGFTRMDAVAAIGGVEAMLRHVHDLAEDLRHALKTEPPTPGTEPPAAEELRQ